MQPSNEEALLEAVKELVAIESTIDNPAGLRRAYEYMREMVLASGKSITIEEFESGGKPSFLAYLGPDRPKQFHIILNGHVDVVPGKPGQYNAVIKDDKLYGRGVYDMKAAAIVLAEVFCEYVDTVPYALGLQIVTDEENAGRDGTLHQITQGTRANFVVCGECGRATNAYEIANEAKGIVIAEISFSGSSAHAAYPWKGDNAVAKAANFIQAVHAEYPIPTEESDRTTMTVTSITANSDAHNKISDAASVGVDARFVAGDPNFAGPADFAAHIQTLDPNAVVTRYFDFSSPLYTNPHDPLLLELKAAAESVEGMPFTLVRRHATSDGRFYGDVGNQACEFGIAGEHQHGDDEYITIEAFRNYLGTMRAFLDRTRTPGVILERDVARVS